jgi:hypothetical protein
MTAPINKNYKYKFETDLESKRGVNLFLDNLARTIIGGLSIGGVPSKNCKPRKAESMGVNFKRKTQDLSPWIKNNLPFIALFSQ